MKFNILKTLKLISAILLSILGIISTMGLLTRNVIFFIDYLSRYIFLESESERHYSERALHDMNEISNAYLENIEYIRLFYDCTGDSIDHYEKIHPTSQSLNGIFGYALRWTDKEYYNVNSPIPTRKQLNITTPFILYSPDSLFCTAILCIHKHYDKIEDLSDVRESYDSRAFIGYREDINMPFKIYPFHAYIFYNYKIPEQVVDELKYEYFKHLTNYGTSYLEGYECNMNDSTFFTSNIFKKDDIKDGCYNFQLYKHLGKIYEYQLYCNQPDSIKRLWMRGIDINEE